MSVYYAQLHDAHPGPSGTEAIISDKHCDFSLDTELMSDRIVVRSWRKLRFVTIRATRTQEFYVSVWDGPRLLLVVKIDPVRGHVNAGDILETDLTWTMMHKEAM